MTDTVSPASRSTAAWGQPGRSPPNRSDVLRFHCEA